MVSALDRLGGQGLSPGQGHCVVFLGKKLYSHSASLHPGVQMGTIYVINSIEKTTLPCSALPPTHHHSFFRDIPPFFS